MDKSDAPRRWFGLWRTAERATGDDPADLGTAFGLDLSLSELGDEGPPPPPSVQGKTGWMQRAARARHIAGRAHRPGPAGLGTAQALRRRPAF